MDALREKVARAAHGALAHVAYVCGDDDTSETWAEADFGRTWLYTGADTLAETILAIPEVAAALALQASVVKVPTTVSKEPQA